MKEISLSHAQLNLYDRLWLGYSGGLDSQVLLHLLAQSPQLKIKLQAIHINHGLSHEANKWQMHCVEQCEKLGIPLHVSVVEIKKNANIEAEARNARYQVFADKMTAEDCLILAHHQEDQAETLLLQLLRGTGVNGLCAMAQHKPFKHGTIARPLIDCSRSEIHDYALSCGLTWVEDESNANRRFSRNFIRHEVMPLLRQRWPAVTTNLARTAKHMQQTKLCLQQLAEQDSNLLIDQEKRLELTGLGSLTTERQDNVIRYWLAAQVELMPTQAHFNNIKHEVIKARLGANPCVQWANYAVRRYRNYLYLVEQNDEVVFEASEWNISNPITIGKYQLMAHPTATCRDLSWNAPDLFAESESLNNSRQLIQLDGGRSHEIRFNCFGATIRLNGHSKRLKKCFQQWGIPPWQRKGVPLLFVDGILAAVIGLAVSDDFTVRDSIQPGVYQLEVKSIKSIESNE